MTTRDVSTSTLYYTRRSVISDSLMGFAYYITIYCLDLILFINCFVEQLGQRPNLVLEYILFNLQKQNLVVCSLLTVASRRIKLYLCTNFVWRYYCVKTVKQNILLFIHSDYLLFSVFYSKGMPCMSGKIYEYMSCVPNRY